MSGKDKAAAGPVRDEAMPAKRHRTKTATEAELEALEASLLADIASFDLDAAQRALGSAGKPVRPAALMESGAVFPRIGRDEAAPPAAGKKVDTKPAKPSVRSILKGSALLEELRKQAELRQRRQQAEEVKRTTDSAEIDRRLRQVFLYLHDFVQQLNILRPAIPREFTVGDALSFCNMVWQEGFADYRAQSHSAGALIEMVSFSFHMAAPKTRVIEREGPEIERFRHLLFDCGLRFDCQEFRNPQHRVVRTRFQVRSELNVNARWRADYERGLVLVESRNLERLGSVTFQLAPDVIDQALLDDFGRLVLAQPNHFREYIRR